MLGGRLMVLCYSLLAIIFLVIVVKSDQESESEDGWVETVEDEGEEKEEKVGINKQNLNTKNNRGSEENGEKRETLAKLKRSVDGFLKSYIDNLKNGEELVISNEAGFSGGDRFKSGDIHIKKTSKSRDGPQLTESPKPTYRYPLGLGQFLLSGCYDFLANSKDAYPTSAKTSSFGIGVNPEDEDRQYDEIPNSLDSDSEDLGEAGEKRKRRYVASKLTNNKTDYKSFCRRFAQLEKNRECNRIIPGEYTIGAGFDIKYENSENSRRKSIIRRHCNYQKYFNKYSVPDVMTANGIYDTKTQTMTFGQSSDYVKFLAARANLDRYSNVFSSDVSNAYGGIMGQKNLSPETARSSDRLEKGQTFEQNVARSSDDSDFWLSQIQSSVLIYDLILDQISPWNIDPEVLVDFFKLPESYFHENAAKKFEKFISRYGTHVVVGAKFGGEFKILHAMRKSRASRIETFAQQSIEDAMRMFSRSWNVATSLAVMDTRGNGNQTTNSSRSFEKKKDQEASRTFTSEYTSTYLSVKGGSQEVAAIVANLNQPDFGDSFIAWLRTVPNYPRAFDLKFESLTSVLDINVASLFGQLQHRESLICPQCPRGLDLSLSEFEHQWQRRLDALKFAITVYLKEPHGLAGSNRFVIDKGDPECRFNIINYLAPRWTELTSGLQEFHVSFHLSDDENSLVRDLDFHAQFGFTDDQAFFIKRDDFWLARPKNGVFSYHWARLVSEPFRSSSTANYINLNGLVLVYNENDATVVIADFEKALAEYSTLTGCDFRLTGYNYNTSRNSSPKPVKKRHVILKRATPECRQKLGVLKTSARRVHNLSPRVQKYWSHVVGVVDYVDPIRAAARARDVQFSVMPCQLKWSNNLMIFLDPPRSTLRRVQRRDIKCLKFTAATQGEFYVVLATTPSDLKSWYIFQISTKGFTFYRSGRLIDLREDSAAGTTGNDDIYQHFFICLNYERARERDGLRVKYGIEMDSRMRVYFDYFDPKPLQPVYYSFGSRTAEVEVLNARLETQSLVHDGGECKPSGENDKDCPIEGRCQLGFHLANDQHRCVDIDECAESTHKCSANAVCENLVGSHKCRCKNGFYGDGLRCQDVDECSIGIHNCSPNAVCINLVGSFECKCSFGLTGDGVTCTDIDECSLDLNDCDWFTTCLNTFGSFRCIVNDY